MVIHSGSMLFHFSKRLLLAASIICIPAYSQFISVGVKAGVPLNDAYVNAGQGQFPQFGTTNRYLIGPEVDINLPFHLGVEADALYRRYKLGGSGVNEWEFPILLKYRFKGVEALHPFVDAGPVFNHVSQIASVTSNTSVPGVAVGGGIDFRSLILHIKPEIRYIHWTDKNYNFTPLNAGLSSNQDQVQFLVGFTF